MCMLIVILMMMAVWLDLYIGDSADRDNCDGGWSVALKLYENQWPYNSWILFYNPATVRGYKVK